MPANTIKLSSLNHTWILDLDGTLVKHNGYKTDGKDTLLPKAKKFLKQIPENDLIVILTSRSENFRQSTISFLENNAIRYNYIIFNAPVGERILINDDKPSGLKCSIAINFERNHFPLSEIIVDKEL